MIAVAVVTVASIALLAGVYNYVEQEKAKLDRSIAVSINGEVHRVAYNLEEEDPFSLWTKGFCDHEGVKLGIGSDALHQRCIGPVMAALSIAASSNSTEAMIIIPPARGTNERTASEEERVSDILLDGVHPSQASSIDSASSSDNSSESFNAEPAVAPQLLKLPLEINGITYIFEYIASAVPEERLTVANTLALNFCNTHGEKLLHEYGVLDSLTPGTDELPESFAARRNRVLVELLSTQCLEPIRGALEANMAYSIPQAQ